MFNSDKPIFKKENDSLGRNKFAVNLANAMLSYKNTDSLVIGLYGEWGSGKSSVANLIIEELKNRNYNDCDDLPVIVNFNPWNFSDQNQLLSQLFKSLANSINNYQNTAESIKDSLDKTAKTVKRVGQIATVAGHVPVPIISNVAKFLAPVLNDYATALLPNNKENIDLQKKRNEITNQLSKIKSKIIIFIDDIDRLNKTEIRQIFQAVKSLGDFPNTIYTLLFDKDIVVKSLEDVQTCNGEDYLKKIVQIPIALPQSNNAQLEKILLEKLNQIIEKHPEYRFNEEYWLSVFNKCVKPFLHNMRDVNRLMNLFEFKYYLIKNEINIADLIAITVFEIFIPEIYQWIKNNRMILLKEYFAMHNRDIINKEYYLEQIKPLCERNENSVKGIMPLQKYYSQEITPQTVLDALCVLFPVVRHAVERMGNSLADSNNCLRREQRISSPQKFNYYFSLSLTDEEIPNEVIDDILRHGDLNKIVQAISVHDKFAHTIIEELHIYSEIIPSERIELLLNVMLHAYNEILDLQYDSLGFPLSGGFYAKYIARTLLKRQSIDKKFEFFSVDITKFPNIGIFIFIDLLRDEWNYYGRYSLHVEKRWDYPPVFEESELNIVEEKVVKNIINIATNDFLRELDDNSFYRLVFAWECLDVYSPAIVDKIKSFISIDDVNLQRIIKQKTTLSYPQGVHSGNQNRWIIEIDSLQKYISIDEAYNCIEKYKKTDYLDSLPESTRNSLIAFALLHEGNSENNSNIVRDDLVQDKLSEWVNISEFEMENNDEIF